MITKALEVMDLTATPITNPSMIESRTNPLWVIVVVCRHTNTSCTSILCMCCTKKCTKKFKILCTIKKWKICTKNYMKNIEIFIGEKRLLFVTCNLTGSPSENYQESITIWTVCWRLQSCSLTFIWGDISLKFPINNSKKNCEKKLKFEEKICT